MGNNIKRPLNPKQDAFARGMAKTGNRIDSYIAAGYFATSPGAIKSAANRLMMDHRIKGQIAYYRGDIVRKRALPIISTPDAVMVKPEENNDGHIFPANMDITPEQIVTLLIARSVYDFRKYIDIVETEIEDKHGNVKDVTHIYLTDIDNLSYIDQLAIDGIKMQANGSVELKFADRSANLKVLAEIKAMLRQSGDEAGKTVNERLVAEMESMENAVDDDMANMMRELDRQDQVNAPN